MCRPDDYPPHRIERLYDVTYYAGTTERTRRARVWAGDTDEARTKVRAIDPAYLATTKPPRIIR